MNFKPDQPVRQLAYPRKNGENYPNKNNVNSRMRSGRAFVPGKRNRL